ncbi:bifunctional diaminohydroxyphosphoribosylaminopyrimidine deaminase/5-amino-6-(5-phosphoribosylamino)uracil reductase RibD [Granulosicoccus sp.]|nr:bifunctional diaminohydroxyphosphoribosylaminopyrimidine deaminase/5-amino-6-(5-phosphoribosylamino)uracil reductase RibD [Granulosicoccus sp.]MDB4222386.1 bifunctional diaminohydroxyphosphoribosylaminopyrimidine deaminase/5-amino-6-(5-phosphoribosylamino)uracil reductase RibD [Granulosicoccus sp.]
MPWPVVQVSVHQCALPPRKTIGFIRGLKEAVQSHEHYMQRALELATRGSGCTSPNPLVGSIVVRDDVILGEGWHEVYGQAHAEVNAISDARNSLSAVNNSSSAINNNERQSNTISPTSDTSSSDTSSKDNHSLDGATIYVTLEPCNHQGATPPCTQAIVAAGIKHVVYALADPNPKAAGGAQWLQSQGVSVTQGVLEDQARFVNRFFLKNVKSQRPYIIAKSASSLDGKTATRTGNSQWITGPAARERGHELRQAVDAIVVGADTVIADDPSLTVRLPETLCAASAIRHPRPVILDSRGRVSMDAKLLNGSLPAKSLVLTTDAMTLEHRQAIESKGHEVVALEKNDNGVGISPEAVVAALGERGMHSVLLEGGASVHGSFRDAGLIDEVWTFLAPSIIGGKNAPAAFSAIGSDALSDATKLHDIHLEQVGDDILIRGCVSPVSTNEQG